MKQKKERIILLVTLVVVFSFGLSTIFSIYSLNTLISENTKEKSIIYANEISSTITSLFSEPKAIALSMNNPLTRSYVENVNSYSEEKLSSVFRDYLSSTVKYFDYDTAFIVPEGNLHYYTEYGYSKTVTPSNPDDDWYEAFLDSGRKYELNVDNDQANDNRTTIYINVRMENGERKTVGVCGVGLKMDSIAREISRFESIQGYEISLVSKNGKIQVSTSTDYKKELLSKNSTNLYKHAPEEIQNAIDSYNFSKSYNYTQRDKDSFFIVKYIDDCQWYLVIDYKGNTIPDAYSLLLKNIIACMLSLAVILTITNLITNRIHKKMHEFKEKSESDKLTGISNRLAFEEAKAKLLDSSLSKITVAVLDINSLKYVNDNIGHNAGDELITGAAKIISSFFEKYGTAYRTGGDEFVVIMDKPFKTPHEEIAKFKNEVSKWKGDLVESLHISVGTASGNMYEYMGIDELISVADKQMYEDKTNYYKEKKLDRRTN